MLKKRQGGTEKVRKGDTLMLTRNLKFVISASN